jgi:hypothetical protein
MTGEVLIATPLGLPGSGRVRYGAAMDLWRSGKLSAETLEVFRICAARDSDDPTRLLAERGLPVPDLGAIDPTTRIAALIDEADRYLAGLHGPGIAEVRNGIATARAGRIVVPAPRTNPVVTTHLDAALAKVAETRPALAACIAATAPLLDWVTYDAYPRAEIGEAFAAGHAFASLVGGGAPLAADDFDLGLFLIAPHVLYRDHCHKAPELYAPLTGPHGWRFGPQTPLVVKPAHDPVWNDPYRPHLTKVGPVPFLALFGWTRDVTEAATVIPASDWAGLEALQLGADNG